MIVEARFPWLMGPASRHKPDLRLNPQLWDFRADQVKKFLQARRFLSSDLAAAYDVQIRACSETLLLDPPFRVWQLGAKEGKT